ncbi:MAG: hypothetical protein U0Q19_11550 [Kineosporiaceae bacterium]
MVVVGRTVSVADFTSGDGAGRAGAVPVPVPVPVPPGLPAVDGLDADTAGPAEPEGMGDVAAALGTDDIGTVAPADDEPESFEDDGRPAPLDPAELAGVDLAASLAASPGVPGRGETLGAVP